MRRATTYSHVNSWKSPTRNFSDSLEENQRAVEAILPGYRFQSHAYPFGNTESFFREVVDHVRASGARVLTVDDALREIGVT